MKGRRVWICEKKRIKMKLALTTATSEKCLSCWKVVPPIISILSCLRGIVTAFSGFPAPSFADESRVEDLGNISMNLSTYLSPDSAGRIYDYDGGDNGDRRFCDSSFLTILIPLDVSPKSLG